jgi:hypothetical protein
VRNNLTRTLIPFVLSVLYEAGHKGLIEAISTVATERPVSENEYRLVQAIRKESGGADADWSEQAGLMNTLMPAIRSAVIRENERTLAVLQGQHARDRRYVRPP